MEAIGVTFIFWPVVEMSWVAKYPHHTISALSVELQTVEEGRSNISHIALIGKNVDKQWYDEMNNDLSNSFTLGKVNE